jgi:hypothetical protein
MTGWWIFAVVAVLLAVALIAALAAVRGAAVADDRFDVWGDEDGE